MLPAEKNFLQWMLSEEKKHLPQKAFSAGSIFCRQHLLQKVFSAESISCRNYFCKIALFWQKLSAGQKTFWEPSSPDPTLFPALLWYIRDQWIFINFAILFLLWKKFPKEAILLDSDKYFCPKRPNSKLLSYKMQINRIE